MRAKAKTGLARPIHNTINGCRFIIKDDGEYRDYPPEVIEAYQELLELEAEKPAKTKGKQQPEPIEITPEEINING